MMNRDVGSGLNKSARLLALLLVSSCTSAPEQAPSVPQRVLVEAHLDSGGKVTKLTVIEGDPRLHASALEAARAVDYPRDCDDDGRPIPSTTKLLVYFGANGKVLKTGILPIIGNGIKASKLRRRVVAPYPKAAKRARIQGLVLLRVSIDKEGNPTAIEPIRGHPELIPAAVAAVKKWRWAPTYIRCEPIPVIATVTVNFVLR